MLSNKNISKSAQSVPKPVPTISINPFKTGEASAGSMEVISGIPDSV